MKAKITQALVERAPAPERGRSILHADPELRGFYLIVTPTKRSFYVQSMVNGRQVRTKIGDHPSMTAKDARTAAAKTLVGMRGGSNPNEERRKARAKGITLRQALESGVPLAELKFLLNHAADSVTLGYLHPSLDHLREHQERASRYILGKLGLHHEYGMWPPTLLEASPGDA